MFELKNPNPDDEILECIPHQYKRVDERELNKEVTEEEVRIVVFELGGSREP